MNTPVTNSPPQQTVRRKEAPRAAFKVTDARGHRLLVRRPDGRPMRVRPSGSLVEAGRIESVQHYLHVPAS